MRYDRDYLKIEKSRRRQMLSTSPDTRGHITHRGISSPSLIVSINRDKYPIMQLILGIDF